ncbi:MAG: uroporphyrinogen-III synthase [Gammaproteobacteria bacterium]|nr:uroporphyrinogen-III synthase [Gammaproteobacteria bacterium]
MSEDPPLFGHTILVTRPAHQAQSLCNEIEKVGGNSLRCPAIEILRPKGVAQARALLKQLRDFDLAIFVSVNAVESALALLAPIKLPQKLQLAAIGASTANCLATHGYQKVIHPVQNFSSEGLLQTEELREVSGKRIAIIRGEGGRQWLAEQLQTAGAEVVAMPIYRRKVPTDSKTILQQALQNNDITMISATSNEGLANITKMAGKLRHKAFRLPLVVLSERNRDFALQLGYKCEIAVVHKTGNKAIIKTLIQLADSMRYR